MLSFRERVELHLMRIVCLGAGEMDEDERQVTLFALLQQRNVLSPSERVVARDLWEAAGCRLEAQFERWGT